MNDRTDLLTKNAKAIAGFVSMAVANVIGGAGVPQVFEEYLSMGVMSLVGAAVVWFVPNKKTPSAE